MTATKTNGATGTPTTTNNTIRDEKKSQSMSFCKDDDEITQEDLAPDGGWGWVIAVAMILVFVTTFIPAASFPIIFSDFLEATGKAGTAATVFNSVFMITYSIACLLTNTLIKKYSMRPVGIVGAVLFALPNVGLAFVNNVYEIGCIYLLQGMGLGLIITICSANFNAYFVKRRAQVMSVSQVIVGLGGIVYPLCVENMIRNYGFRGTAAITGALSLNCIAGMALMHPIEWHARKPEEIREERARLREEQKLRGIALSNRRSTIDVIHISSKTKWSSLRSLKDERKDVPLLNETFKTTAARVASISEMEGGMKNRTKSGSIYESLNKQMTTLSTSSLANLVTTIGAFGDSKQVQTEKNQEKVVDKAVLAKEEKEVGKKQTGSIWDEILEMSLLKNPCFINICLGVSFVLTSDYTFMYLLPLMMLNAGYTKSHAALAMTVSASAELASRIFLAIFTILVDVKPKYIFFVSMIFMAFAKIGFIFFDNTLRGTLTMLVIIGVIRSWLQVPQPLVIVEDVSINKLASAYGIFAVISGVISIVFGPIAGLIKDWTNSFVACQIAFIAMNVLFVIPWAVQFLSVDLPKRRKERADKIAARTSASFSAD